MELTAPVTPEQLQTAYPRDTRNMGAEAGGELEILLRIEERALRTLFGVTNTDEATDAVLADAMLAAWPSFLQQVRQVAQESVSADGSAVSYNRAGVIDFVFPSFIGSILSRVAEVGESAAYPSSTQLVR